VSEEVFRDSKRIALLPMGFCYPGKKGSGDMLPRPECAPLWHPPILSSLQQVKLRIYLGRPALVRYFGDRFGDMEEAVEAYRDLLPGEIALPHPSPRNQPWIKKRPWFEAALLPLLRERVREVVAVD
jgi:uracil-DNA glycosylase